MGGRGFIGGRLIHSGQKFWRRLSSRRRVNILIVVGVLTLIVGGLLRNDFTAQEIGSNEAHNGLPQLPAEQGGPVIYRPSESVLPGETLNLTGGNFSAQATAVIQLINNNGTRAASRALTLENQSAFLIQATVPADLTPGLWSVWVEQIVDKTLVASNEVYINAPDVSHYPTPDVAPGESLAIYGRNLTKDKNDANGYRQSAVVFKHNGTSLTASVTGGDWFHLVVKAPAGLQPGTDYDVYVSNGLGGELGLIKAQSDKPLKVVAAGTADTLGLGVNWARKLDFVNDASRTYNVKTDPRLARKAVGDGVTNDRQAIQEAIDAAAAGGGGVVYLPQSTYYVSIGTNDTIVLRSKVVLKGEGTDKTTIKYGVRDVKDLSYFLRFQDIDNGAGGLAGITSLTITNINHDNSDPNLDFVGGSAGISFGNAGQTFMTKVKYDMGPHDFVGSEYSSQLLISDSEMTSLYSWIGPAFRFSGKKPNAEMSAERSANSGYYNRYSGNTFTYLNGRFSLFEQQDSTFENNQVISDVRAQPNLQTHNTCCSGGVTFNFSNFTALIGNTVKTVNGINRFGVNDREAFVTENPLEGLWHMGSVTDSTETTLTDNTQQWEDVINGRWPTYNNGLSFGQPHKRGDAAYNASTNTNGDDWDGDVPLKPGSRLQPWDPISIQRLVVAITDGTGQGQWRYITANTPTTLTIDRPWDLKPDSTSQYKITVPVTIDVVIAKNTIENANAGIILYDGGIRNLIADNRVINAGEVSIYAKDIHSGYNQPSCDFMGRIIGDDPYSPTRESFPRVESNNVPAAFHDCYRLGLAWDNEIVDNTNENTNGNYPAQFYVINNNFINGSDHDEQDYLTDDCNGDGKVDSADAACNNDYRKNLRAPFHNNSMFNTVLRDNKIVAGDRLMDGNYLSKLPNRFNYFSFDFSSKERYYVLAGGSAQGLLQETDAANKAVIGTILDNNTISNMGNGSDDQPYIFSLGTSQTTLKSLGQPSTACYRINLTKPRGDQSAGGLNLLFLDANRQTTNYKTNQQYVASLGSEQTDAIGRATINDAAANFLLRYRYTITQRADNGVIWQQHHWVPIDANQKYTTWYKVPGYLGKRTNGVLASALFDPTKCGTTGVLDLTKAILGDFNNDNQITEADITVAIQAYNGTTDSAAAKTALGAYNDLLTIKDLAALIKTFNTSSKGDPNSP